MLKAKKQKIIKHKLPSHSTSNLKSEKPWDQSSIKVFLKKSLHENEGKLNTNTFESSAVVRHFSSSSVLSPKLLFSSEKSRNDENSLFNVNLEVCTSCSKKSERISSSIEIQNRFI